jgi:hypothetical protein
MNDTTVLGAETVTFHALATIPVGQSLVWRRLTATHEAPYSPLRNEPPPDYTVCVDEEESCLRVLRFDALGLIQDDSQTLIPATLSVAAILEAIGSGPELTPVCAFGTSIEPDRAGDSDVPWVAVWTGPVWDAADVVADLPSSGLQGCRLRYRGVLSHRVNTVEASGADPWERLHLQQYTGGEWVLRGGDHYPDLPRRRRDDLHTLEDVLSWAEGVLGGHGVAGSRLTAFAVSNRDNAAPLTVWVW